MMLAVATTEPPVGVDTSVEDEPRELREEEEPARAVKPDS